jgi:hypothetical protein
MTDNFNDPIIAKKKIFYMTQKRLKLNNIFNILNKHLRLIIDLNTEIPEEASASVIFEKLIRKIIYSVIDKNEKWFKLSGTIRSSKILMSRNSIIKVFAKRGNIDVKNYSEKILFSDIEKLIYNIIGDSNSSFYDSIFKTTKMYFGLGTSIIKISKYPNIFFKCEDVNTSFFEYNKNECVFFFKKYRVSLDFCFNKFKSFTSKIISSLNLQLYNKNFFIEDTDLYYYIFKKNGRYIYNYLIVYNNNQLIINSKESFYFDFIIETYDKSLSEDFYPYGTPICYSIIPSLIKNDLINKDIVKVLSTLASPPIAISSTIDNAETRIKEKSISLNPGAVNILDDINLDIKILSETSKFGLQPFLNYKEFHLKNIRERLEFDLLSVLTFRKTDTQQRQIDHDRLNQMSFYLLKFEDLISNILGNLILIFIEYGYIKKPSWMTNDNDNDYEIDIYFDFGLSTRLAKLNNIKNFLFTLNSMGVFQLKPDLINNINFETIFKELGNCYDVEEFISIDKNDNVNKIKQDYNTLYNENKYHDLFK